MDSRADLSRSERLPLEPVTVLYVGGDADSLDPVTSALADRESFDVVTATSADEALDRLREADCLVSESELPSRDGLELLATVRERRPSLPFVLFAESFDEGIDSELRDDSWAMYLRKGDPESSARLLARRVCRLVDHRRIADTADRALTAIETAQDGIAIVRPDGTFEFVNRVFAARFGYRSEELVGQSWHECYPEREVQRLESSALPTVRGDWQWTGGCVGQRSDGETFTAPTRIVGLDDGSFVFSVGEPESDGGDADSPSVDDADSPSESDSDDAADSS